MEEKDMNLEANESYEEEKASEQIPLSLLIEKAKGFTNGEITQEEMAEFGGEITIRGYIPILEKMGIIMSILNQHIYSTVETQEIKMVEMYRNIFFYLMLSGYAGIDCTDREDITYYNYDLLYPIYAPFILSYCKEDYELTMNMLKDSINLYGIQGIVDGFAGINEETLKEATKANQDLMKELGANKELIHELKEIAEFNDPTTKKVVDGIRKIAVENSNKKETE